MNLLLDRAPGFVEIGGTEYPIDADFRNCIKFESLMFDPDVPDELRGILALRLFYPKVPPDIPAAFEKIVWFYGCGEEAKKGNPGRSGGKRIYSYEHDGGYIFAAFLSDYGIDLESVKFLHWWKFRALFDSLRPENMMVKIMGFRAADTRKMRGEQKKYYLKMQRRYALPRPRGEQEKLDEIDSALLRGGNVSGVLNRLGK
ncbi:MAG: bacteriophage Gp15 family protein [Oscillospiraceae bacterium]|jgi:hypothetical protein|nr:bacteriophage Gp15 family protein [Oscillospiraceae bacterium]